MKRRNCDVASRACFLLLVIIGITAIVGILTFDASGLNENLTVTAEPNTVYTNENTNITITVICAISDNCGSGEPVNNADITLSGAFTGSGETNHSGKVTIQALPTSIGDINVEVKSGKDTGSTKITSKTKSVLPQLVMSANKDSIYVDMSTDVTFSVKGICTTGTISCKEGPVPDAKIKLDNGETGITDNGGQAKITIHPTNQGTVTAQVSKTGYEDGSTKISVITFGSPIQLSISTNTSNVNVGIPKNVTYYVTRPCGTIPGDNCTVSNPSLPVEGASITISGVVSGNGITSSNGKESININADNPGIITATANKPGYLSASKSINATIAINFAPDKDKYYRGEIVKLILSNEGGFPIQLGSWFIKNDSSGNIVHLSSPIGNSDLSPGQSITLNWDQTNNNDLNNSQCEPGPYAAEAEYSFNGVNYTLDARFDLNRCTKIVNNVQQLSSIVGQDANFPIDLSNTNREWNITTWYINGVEAYNQTNIRQTSSYLNDSTTEGEWNVTAIAQDGCSSITWSWMWKVDKPSCINVQNYRNMSTFTGQETIFKSGNLSSISDAWNFTWYIDNNVVFNETGKSQSSYVGNSNSVGTRNVTLTATKDCNIVNWTWTWTVTQKPPSSSSGSSGGSSGGGSNGGGGSGGGGGGIISAEPFSNIIKFERQDADLKEDIPVPFTFSIPELSIYQVYITGTSNEGGIGMRVEHLKNTSVLVNRNPIGVVYANENVWLESKRYKDVLVRFRVNNSWFKYNNISNENIQLLRFNDGWKRLDTNITKSDDQFTYFEASSNGLSAFAISAVEQIPQNIGNTTTTEPLPVQSPKVIIVKPEKKAPGFDYIITMISIISVLFIMKRYGTRRR